ncbi:MAG: diacylglycerol kinase family protein [Candidatus Saccharibacteria bacterium]|nr:diacylglycerol kinase family protein [Candidatus Saccharibacteria bacterium]
MENIKRVIIVHSSNSTRAKKYQLVRADFESLAEKNNWVIDEIELVGVPYFEAIKQIMPKLRDNDLVIAAGGDGITQVTFNAVYSSRQDVVFATIPLGNSNDTSRAFNGKHRSVTAIVDQPVVDFYPLNVVTNNHHNLAIASYISFGATTILVDYLNADSGRSMRKRLKALTPAASLPIKELGNISRAINELDFPDFTRSNEVMTDDSIGFFIIPAAHNVLRLPKDVRLASSEFFFHHAVTKDKDLIKKALMAGRWALKFPGEMTELEELDFGDNQIDIIANVSGDNINLGPIKRLSAIRSTRPVKILFN